MHIVSGGNSAEMIVEADILCAQNEGPFALKPTAMLLTALIPIAVFFLKPEEAKSQSASSVIPPLAVGRFFILCHFEWPLNQQARWR